MVIIFVYVSAETTPLLSAQISPLYLPLTSHALEKDTTFHNPETSLLKVKLFGGVSDFSYKYSKFQILVGFIAVSKTYIPFIQTKILISPLENHFINFWYVNPVCLTLKRYYTKIWFTFTIYSNEKSLSVFLPEV